MSGMTVNGWRMMDALASFIGLSPRALPAGGLFDAAKGFASGKGCDEPTSKSHCGSFCTDHHYKPDECGCDVCGSFGGCSFSCTADNKTRFECPKL
jgi:hypothetical protein